jgi:hypothetical protein
MQRNASTLDLNAAAGNRVHAAAPHLLRADAASYLIHFVDRAHVLAFAKRMNPAIETSPRCCGSNMIPFKIHYRISVVKS